MVCSTVLVLHGTFITANKREERFLQPRSFRALEWFRAPGFSDVVDGSYGKWKGTYTVNRTLVLLNLGHPESRQWVLDFTGLTVNEFNPDFQYGGGEANLRVHEAIAAAPYFKRFDGTIITPGYTQESLREDLDGPEEIVLFTQRVFNAVSLVGVELTS